MKEDSLGLNHLLSFFATVHTVSPLSSAVSSGHLRIAPPQSLSGMPRCFEYHAASAALSPVLLMNTPPIPVTFAIAQTDSSVPLRQKHAQVSPSVSAMKIAVR